MEIHRSAVNDSQREFKVKVNFLRRAIKDEAHLKAPIGLSEEDWVTQRNIVGVLLGSPATASELGRQYGRSRERIRQLYNQGIEGLWKNSSKKLQKQFHLISLLGAGKPTPLHLRIKTSELKDGPSWKIFKDIQDGVVTKEELGKRRLRSDIKRVLRSWGLISSSEKT